MKKNLGLHHVGRIQPDRPGHLLAAHAVLQQQLHGVRCHAGNSGLILYCELGGDERGHAAFETRRGLAKKNLGLHHVGRIEPVRPRHLLAAHAVLYQQLHGICHHAGNSSVLFQRGLG